MKTREKKIIILLILISFISFLICLTAGAADISVDKILSPLGGSTLTTGQQVIIFQVRMPRLALAFLVGLALASSGIIFQAIFKNPMAGPYTIGLSSGAALGATAAILYGWTGSFGFFYYIPVSAFLSSLCTTYLVYRLAQIGGKVPVTTLLLAGIALGSFIAAIQSFLMIRADHDLQAIFFWITGSLAGRNWQHVQMVTPYIALGLVITFYYLKEMNILLLGEDTAQYLGVDIEKVKKTLVISATLMAASAVSVSGVIGFVGIVIPHMVRLLMGPDHRLLWPASLFIGGTFMMVADSLARTILAPTEIPVGIITAFLGVPFFIYLLRREKSFFF